MKSSSTIYLILLTIFFGLLLNCSSKKEEYLEYYENGQIKKRVQINSNNEYDGVVTEYFENGIIKSEAHWKNDKMNGITQFYHPNGQLKEKHNRLNNLIDGQVEWYSENGDLISKIPYQSGLKQGTSFTYDSLEQVIFEDRFINDTLYYSVAFSGKKK